MREFFGGRDLARAELLLLLLFWGTLTVVKWSLAIPAINSRANLNDVQRLLICKLPENEK